jgi:GDPmannose 4,6-dehydratase
MWRILQQDTADDYVLATNETHSVKEFVEQAFAHVDLDWKEFVRFDKRYERPSEVDLLIGNAAKAKRQLDWEPQVRFKELVGIMVEADLAVAQGRWQNPQEIRAREPRTHGV